MSDDWDPEQNFRNSLQESLGRIADALERIADKVAPPPPESWHRVECLSCDHFITAPPEGCRQVDRQPRGRVRAPRVRPCRRGCALMNAWMYQPGVAATPAPVTCTHLSCNDPATHVRGSFPFCFGHFLVALMWEQPRVDGEDAA